MKPIFLSAKTVLVTFTTVVLMAVFFAAYSLNSIREQSLLPAPIAVESIPDQSLKKNISPKKIGGAFFIETFSTAPTHWRTAGAALASVTARWQCEPKWTFFSLENDRKIGKSAAIWHKAYFPGDVSIDLLVSNKMDSSRGNPYSYARDVNITIASDGNDLRKGYTFSFGGDDNTCTSISRNGVVVKKVDRGIPKSMDYSRHWFAVKVERIGGTLRFSVDSKSPETGLIPELVYEDPEPLSGDRVAIWTYDHTISIAKISISGETNGQSESPDFQSPPLLTKYDSN